MMRCRVAALAALVLVAPIATVAKAQIPAIEVRFPRGESSTTISGAVVGDQARDYVVRANAGQTLEINMSGSPIVYFNVLPPGSDGEAIFVGSTEGARFSGPLGMSGPYKVRVYQMRATARRGEAGNFRLTIAATGGGGGGGSLAGIAGMDSIKAFDAMIERGFRNVDSFESGNSQYGIFYRPANRMCAQLTMADGRILDARDIQTHPKCR